MVANGTKRQIAFWLPDGRFRSKAEVNERASSIASVVDDPKRSFEAFNSTCLSALVQDRAMEAWYYPLLHEWSPTGGSHGKPHRTTKILSHARWRSSCVFARSARAATGQDPARWIHPSGNPEQRSSSRGIRARDARPRLCRRAQYYLRVSLLWR